MDNRVALLKCPDYDPARVEAAVRRAVDLLGGMKQFVSSGQQVLVKPNLLMAAEPDRAITTHPALVRAVVILVQEAGGQVLIADNPFVVPGSRAGWQNLYERTGLAAVAAETGAQLNTRILPQQQPHPRGELIKLVDTSSFLLEAEVVISLPKLKTHNSMRFTGAVKNLFGTVPGTTKAGYHVKLQTADRFADMLLDLVTFVRPALTIMDAVVGMDGDGPSAGRPFPIGALLASPNPVALDVAALALVGHELTSVPVMTRAVRRGWTTGLASDLALLGEDLATLRVEGFRLPSADQPIPKRIPAFLRRLATRQMVASPHVSERCIGCGQCIENCPMRTIHQVEGRALIDLSNCIRCYCCHELCPEHAIDLRRPLVGRVLGRLGR
jgi:uncharacterized protein (DUF362 family)/NAD-dependent dihydropyrimidine dehydrogenase PreA subunit